MQGGAQWGTQWHGRPSDEDAQTAAIIAAATDVIEGSACCDPSAFARLLCVCRCLAASKLTALAFCGHLVQRATAQRNRMAGSQTTFAPPMRVGMTCASALRAFLCCCSFVFFRSVTGGISRLGSQAGRFKEKDGRAGTKEGGSAGRDGSCGCLLTERAFPSRTLLWHTQLSVKVTIFAAAFVPLQLHRLLCLTSLAASSSLVLAARPLFSSPVMHRIFGKAKAKEPAPSLDDASASVSQSAAA